MDGKRLDLIIGRLKGETTTTLQAFRYPKDEWKAEDARKHCRSHDGTFEAAGETSSLHAACAAEFNPVERRAFPGEVRLIEQTGKSPVLRGLGIPYGTRSQVIYDFVEVIRVGAFADSLKPGRSLKSYFNHDPSNVLATTESEPPLRVSEDASGIWYELDVPDTNCGQDLAKHIRSKRVKGSSFAFRVMPEGQEWHREGDLLVREVTKAEFYELGPVTDPAYLSMSVGFRSATQEVFDSYIARFQEEQKAVEIEARRKQEQVAALRRRLDLKAKV